MSVLGITGGIATGKSSFAKLFTRQTGATLFDADQFSRGLLDHDEEVRSLVRKEFGDSVFGAGGAVNRALLRQLVFADPERRRALEGILHPVIRAAWLKKAENARASKRVLAVDIPLLFETDAESHFDAIIVVACSAATQRARLSNQRNLDNEMAANIIAAQMDLNLKIARATHVVWNDGPLPALEAQAALLARRFQ